MKFEIKCRWTSKVLFSCEAESTKEAVEKAVQEKANLGDANLGGAYLRDAKNITADTNLTGEPWSEYLSAVVPALLTAGGKTVAEVVATGCWECHSWENCPMHVALDIGDSSEAPPLIRPRVEQFVQLFDARLIPCPEVEVAEAAS